MRVFLLVLALLCSGCTVMARGEYIKLLDYESSSRDKLNDVFCYQSRSELNVEVCSKSFRSKSLSIGFLVPIIPQLNRDDRLAYDIKRKRVVELKNLSTSEPIILSRLGEVKLCSSNFQEKCDLLSEISIEPKASVWLELPPGARVPLEMRRDEISYEVELEEFTRHYWHLVSV